MEYISNLHQKYKPKRFGEKLPAIKAFYGYLEYEELIRENPFTRLRLKLNMPLILPRTISLPVIEAILTAAYQMKEKAAKTLEQINIAFKRYIAVLELLFATGITRVSELCALQYSDVRLNEGEIKIYGKRDKNVFVQNCKFRCFKCASMFTRKLIKLQSSQIGAFLSTRLHKPSFKIQSGSGYS